MQLPHVHVNVLYLLIIVNDSYPCIIIDNYNYNVYVCTVYTLVYIHVYESPVCISVLVQFIRATIFYPCIIIDNYNYTYIHSG